MTDIAPLTHTDHIFDAAAEVVRERFALVQAAGLSLFQTDADDLFGAYLESMPEEHRQHHNCSACRTFINRFGGLVAITPEGRTVPAMWTEKPVDGIYGPSIAALHRAVAAARVTGVFLSKEPVWGIPETGDWRHFAVKPKSVFVSLTMSAGQAMAEKREHFGTLSRGLADFTVDAVNQALTLLRADALYRAEKVTAPAEFLHGLQTAQANAKGKDAKRNVVWLAVATAPAGFCTPRSSMIGTLLEDIMAGKPFEDVKRLFAAKMSPLLYQRPQVDAAAGNIKQAEEIIAQLGIQQSLRRRFARLDEVATLWSPAPTEEAAQATDGVFRHLKPRDAARQAEPMETPTAAITWEKFARTVLPNALGISVYLERTTMNFGALVTAVDPDAPPILRWDHPEARNPLSSYVYINGSMPSVWGLTPGTWADVTGVALQPGDSKAAMFILAGAVDQRNETLALFPENLRSELHSIRRTIEQFSRAGKMEGSEEASACGLFVPGRHHRLRVKTATGFAFYHIDRWD